MALITAPVHNVMISNCPIAHWTGVAQWHMQPIHSNNLPPSLSISSGGAGRLSRSSGSLEDTALDVEMELCWNLGLWTEWCIGKISRRTMCSTFSSIATASGRVACSRLQSSMASSRSYWWRAPHLSAIPPGRMSDIVMCSPGSELPGSDRRQY